MLRTDEPHVLVVATEPDATVLSAPIRRVGWPLDTALIQSKAPEQLGVDVIVFSEAALPVEVAPYFQWLRAQTPAAILVAGWGGASELAEMLLDGADMYLSRPIREEMLLARIKSLSSRLRRQGAASRLQATILEARGSRSDYPPAPGEPHSPDQGARE